jgi:hypothetical protein
LKFLYEFAAGGGGTSRSAALAQWLPRGGIQVDNALSAYPRRSSIAGATKTPIDTFTRRTIG